MTWHELAWLVRLEGEVLRGEGRQGYEEEFEGGCVNVAIRD